MRTTIHPKKAGSSIRASRTSAGRSRVSSRGTPVVDPPQVPSTAASAIGAVEEQYPEAAVGSRSAVEPAGTGDGHRVLVRFELRSVSARKIFLAGSFNNWQPDATEMVRAADGTWVRIVALLPGVHEYRFVVDGRWMTDPDRCREVPNPFGETNSVMEVKREFPDQPRNPVP